MGELLPVASKTNKGLMPANFYMNVVYTLEQNKHYKIGHIGANYLYQELTYNSYTGGKIGEGRICCSRQASQGPLSVAKISNRQNRLSAFYVSGQDGSIDIYISVESTTISLWSSHPSNPYSLNMQPSEVSVIPENATRFTDF